MSDHQFQPGNEIGKETRWQPGESGNPKGRPPGIGASTRDWWGRLAEVDKDENALFSLDDLHKIVDAPQDSKAVSTPKRIAARQLLAAVSGGINGHRYIEMMFDRTEGKARQNIDFNINEFELKRIVLMDEGSKGSHVPELMDIKQPPLLPPQAVPLKDNDEVKPEPRQTGYLKLHPRKNC